MTDTNDMRREFEQYIYDSIVSEVGVEFALQKDIDGNYYTAWVSHRWGGWQAATERAAKVVEAMTERKRMNSSQKPHCEYAAAIRQATTIGETL